MPLPDADGAPRRDDLSIELLAAHPGALPRLRDWFEAEWPAHYGPDGAGNAEADLRAYANDAHLPLGVVALRRGTVCGVAALKASSIESHAHLTPWAAAGWVHPALRRRGIGAQLLRALEEHAGRLGFERIFCGTSTAESLLMRCGWELHERIIHDGEPLGIYGKRLAPRTRPTGGRNPSDGLPGRARAPGGRGPTHGASGPANSNGETTA